MAGKVRVPSGLSLVEGEVPYWYGRMSWRANLSLLLIGVLAMVLSLGSLSLNILLAMAMLGLGLLLILLAILRVYGSEYFITNMRIYTKYGVIRRRIFEIRVEWITGSYISQSLLGRLYNYGDIVVSVPGLLTFAALVGVSDPMRVRLVIEDVLRKNRERARIEEKLWELEKEFEFGRISEEKYLELKKRYEEELKKYL